MKLVSKSCHSYKFYTVDGKEFVAWTGSFGNCQNTTIRYFNYLLSESPTYINNYFFEIYGKTGRPYIVIDIQKHKFDKLNELINKKPLSDLQIVSKQFYKNGNGSDMCMLILNIKNLKKYYE